MIVVTQSVPWDYNWLIFHPFTGYLPTPLASCHEQDKEQWKEKKKMELLCCVPGGARMHWL